MDEEPVFLDLSKPERYRDGVQPTRRASAPPLGFLAALGSDSLSERDNSGLLDEPLSRPRKQKRLTTEEWRVLLADATDLAVLALRIGRKLSTVQRKAYALGWGGNNSNTKVANLPDDEIDSIADQVRRGIPVAEIAKSYGVHKVTMYRLLEKHGIDLPHPQQNFCPDAPRVFCAFAEHKTLSKTAEALGDISFGRVQHILKHFHPTGERRDTPRRSIRHPSR